MALQMTRARPGVESGPLEALNHVERNRELRLTPEVADWLTTLSPTDLYLTTIERFVAAVGGRLDVAAVFEDVKIDLPQ